MQKKCCHEYETTKNGKCRKKNENKQGQKWDLINKKNRYEKWKMKWEFNESYLT